MSLVSRSPAASRRRRWMAVAAVTIALAVAGLLLVRPSAVVVLWVLLVAALVAHLAARRASDCSVLAELEGWRVADLATQLAVIPAQSSSPLVDLARIRAVGGGVVTVDGVVRVLPERRVEHLDVDLVLPGHWWELARPAAEIDAGVAVDRLRRLPDEDEVWIVRSGPVLRMISGDGLRAAAGAVRGVHGRRARSRALQARTGADAAARRPTSAQDAAAGGRVPQRR